MTKRSVELCGLTLPSSTRAGFLTAAALVLMAASPDYESPEHPWISHQHNVSGQWCCDISDGYLLEDSEWRSSGAAYEVLIKGHWTEIPSWALRDPAGGPNPTGKAIVWYTDNEFGVRIYCFAPGSEW